MVERQIARRGVTDDRVLDAFYTVPRHLFVPEYQRQFAYSDGPLSIGSGQTISQPYIVAYMTQALELQEGDRVLEIGTGSGYQAAVLAELDCEVHTIERHLELAEKAEKLLKELGYENINIHLGDGTHGLLEFAPYQGVIVTAAAPAVPQPLLDQLADGGRLIMPVGGRSGQILKRWKRSGDHFKEESLSPVAFVPLIGEFGWKEP
jgi:protein-L-isoaspartate(D-aspartate) O-methyltransferase